MKKILSIILTGTICFSAFSSVYAAPVSENPHVIWGTVKECTENNGSLETSDPFDFTEYDFNIKDSTLIIDAATGTPILSEKVMENQPCYVYPDFAYENYTPNALAVIANIPQDFGAPLFYTVKDIKQEGENLKIKFVEDSREFTLTKDTVLDRIAPYGNPTIDSIPTYDEIKEGMKLLIYTGKDNELEKCFLTPHMISEPQKTENISVKINGEAFEGDVYIANGEVYLPLRSISEKAGFEVSWDNDTQTAFVKVSENTVSLPIGNEHYKINDTTFVPVSFFTDILNLNIEF